MAANKSQLNHNDERLENLSKSNTDESCTQQQIQPSSKSPVTVQKAKSSKTFAIKPNQQLITKFTRLATPAKRGPQDALEEPVVKKVNNSNTSPKRTETTSKTLFDQFDESLIDAEMEETPLRPEMPKQQTQGGKPPPIVINGGSAEEIRRMANSINNQPRSFTITIKKDRFATKTVIASNMEDYKKLVENLKNKQYQFHTYPTKEEPLMKFVLYGLPVMDPQDIISELNELNISTAKVVQMSMKRRRHADDQNYLLYFKSEKHKGEQESFLKKLNYIRSLYGYRIRWAKYENKRGGPSQCSKCLQFGHGAQGCYKTTICFRCTGNHPADKCEFVSSVDNRVPKENLKCHFCGEQHTSVWQHCKARLEIIEKWKGKSVKGNIRQSGQPKQHLPDCPKYGKSNFSSSKITKISVLENQNQNKLPENKSKQNLIKSTLRKVPTQVDKSEITSSKSKKKQKKNKKKSKLSFAVENLVHQKQNERKEGKAKDCGNSSNRPVNKDIVKENEQTTMDEPSDFITCDPSTSGINLPTDEPTSRCMMLITKLLELVTKNPRCIEQLEKAISTIANCPSDQYGL